MTFKKSTENVNLVKSCWLLKESERLIQLETQLDFFDNMYRHFQDEGFKSIKDTGFWPRSTVMIKKCTDHPGYVAAVLSDHVEEYQIGIVKDEKIAKQLHKFRDFEPVDNTLIPNREGIKYAIKGLFPLFVAGAVTGFIGSEYLLPFTNIVGDDVPRFIIGNGIKGGLVGLLTDIAIPFIHKGFNIVKTRAKSLFACLILWGFSTLPDLT